MEGVPVSPINGEPVDPFANLPIVDPGNRLLSPTSALWQAETIHHPAFGQKVLVTIRTPSTTLTLLLDKPDAERLADDIARACGEASGLIVPARPGPMVFW